MVIIFELILVVLGIVVMEEILLFLKGENVVLIIVFVLEVVVKKLLVLKDVMVWGVLVLLIKLFLLLELGV